MALQFFDGFDNYALSAGDILNRRGGGWQWNASRALAFSTTTRNGLGQSVLLPSGQLEGVAQLFGTATSPQKTMIFGFAMIFANKGSLSQIAGEAYMPHIKVMQGGSFDASQCSIAFDTLNNAIRLYRGDIATGIAPHTPSYVHVADSPNNLWTQAAWCFMEIAITVGSSDGAITVRVDGSTVWTASGLNLKTQSAALIDGICFEGHAYFVDSARWAWQIDDFYVADTTTGPGPYAYNTFLGDVTVKTLFPVGNASVQWTPLAGSNWQEVAEQRTDGDTSYNSSATVGATDLFNFAALTATVSAVVALQVVGNYRKDDAGLRQITHEVVSGGSTATGTARTVTSQYSYLSDLFLTDPATALPWTATAVNALQAGYVLTT